MRLPLSFFDSKIRTDLIQRMSDQNRLQNFLTYRVIDFIFYLLNVAVFATLLFKYDPFIFIIFFSLSLIAFIWSLTFLKRRRILDYHRFAEQNVNSNVVYEIINGMHDIKINNDEQYRLKRWEKSQLKLNNYSLRGLLLNYYQLWGASLIDKIRDVIIIIIASIMVINKQSSLGILMTISYIIGQISGSLDKIHSFIRDLQDANISLKRINEVYTKKEERYCGMHIEDKNIYTKGININVDNVFFHYPGLDNPYILKNITFEIPSHKIVALVGNSGCGKTTLAKLLLGFYEPQKGCITNDNYKLSDIPITEWREKCGCVLQDGYIFSDTIAHNIAMGIEKIDYMKLKNVCKMSCIDNYINTLPLKYETVIGNEGLEVSGGQKQRILIARALYKDPDFLVFDEATSHLDAENEAAIMSNLYNYFHDRTILIIAHRLSTVVNADKILFMENGHIIEQGTHDELCDFKGKYYKLVKNQIQLI